MAEYLNGWIKLHRQIISWEWFKKPETLLLFIYCLTRANIADGTWRNIPYKRGQFITSLDSIRKDTGLTIQQTRTALKHLISTGELTSNATNQYRIITICKFNDYQQMSDDDNKQCNSQSTSDQQANPTKPNKQSTTGREEEEDIEIRRGRRERKISSIEDKKKLTFVPPKLTDVIAYMRQKGITSFDAESFVEYYEERDWYVGKKKMSDWRKVVDRWDRKNKAEKRINITSTQRKGVTPAGYGVILPDGTEYH